MIDETLREQPTVANGAKGFLKELQYLSGVSPSLFMAMNYRLYYRRYIIFFVKQHIIYPPVGKIANVVAPVL